MSKTDQNRQRIISGVSETDALRTVTWWTVPTPGSGALRAARRSTAAPQLAGKAVTALSPAPDQALVPPLGRTLGDVLADSLSDDVGDRAPLLEGDLATPHAA